MASKSDFVEWHLFESNALLTVNMGAVLQIRAPVGGGTALWMPGGEPLRIKESYATVLSVLGIKLAQQLPAEQDGDAPPVDEPSP